MMKREERAREIQVRRQSPQEKIHEREEGVG